jgi:hypothetical protein
VVVADLNEGVQLATAGSMHIQDPQGCETDAYPGHAGPAAVAMELKGLKKDLTIVIHGDSLNYS